MRQELDPEYDVIVDNMLTFEGDVPEGWEVKEAEFISVKSKKPKSVKMNVIHKKGEDNTQIFRMADGRWVLEVDTCETCDYFWSNDLVDLI